MKNLILFLLMIGCSTPSPQFIVGKSNKGRFEIGGNRFLVFYTSEFAQAIRENNRFGAKSIVIKAQAIAAIESVTKCAVVRDTVEGDVVRVDAKIECPG